MKDLRKTDPVRKTPLFIRELAFILALIMLPASVVRAGPPVPGSVAVLEPPMPLPEMRAAWDGIRGAIYLDPLLLIKGRDQVSEKLVEWTDAAQAVRSSHLAADRITLDHVQTLIEKAWGLYYRFDYDQAAQILDESKELLQTPGDSGFRTRLMFEVLLARGVLGRAAGDKAFGSYFIQAAAMDPDRELSIQRYSPETVSLYQRLRSDLLAKEKVPVNFEGTPADAAVILGGVDLKIVPPGTEYSVLPGLHFLEFTAPGYEPWGMSLDARRFEPADVRFELVPAGPEGDPDSFFLQRFRAGDRTFMTLLAEKLDVDYLFIPDPQEDVLKAWLIDGQGRTVQHDILWKVGDTKESGYLRADGMLAPLRQVWDRDRTASGVLLNLPPPGPVLSDDEDGGKKSSAWSRYAIAVGILLLVGAAAGSETGGGTRIEAAW
jgi:hypothetical protein